MKKKTNLVFFSANRAEYSLIHPFLEIFSENPFFNVGLIVAGSHLDKKFGSTYGEIKKDNVKILSKIEIPLKTNSFSDTAAYSNLLQIEINRILKKTKVDIAFASSDRFETFSFVVAAYLRKIPIIHYEGGDLTEGGALDDNIRHAITKLANIHLTSNSDSLKRILKMGEEKWRCLNIGYSPIFSIKKQNFSTSTIRKKFFLDKKKPLILFTLHPIIKDEKQASKEVKESFSALERLYKNNFQIIITYPNFDPGYRDIVSKIKIFKKNNKRAMVFKHLGRKNYHSLLYYIGKNKNGVCLGNSSSGIKEAILFKCPTINIGNRQNSRLKPLNVIDASASALAFFSKVIKNTKIKKNLFNPYGLKKSFSFLPNTVIKLKNNKYLQCKKCTY